MADFINFEVDLEDDSDHDDEVSGNSELDSLKSFIDNDGVNNDVNFYRNFDNIETDIEQNLNEGYDKGLHDLENFEEISNSCEGSIDELEVDDFKDSAKKTNNFAENLFPKPNKGQKIEHNKIIRVILYAIRFGKENKKYICDKDEFKKVIDENLFEQLGEEKYKFILDLQKFHNNCYEINSIFSKYNYFLRIFKSKNKFRQLSMK